jgi:S1-C subfamily serine protease
MVRLNPKLADYFGTSEGVLVADVTDDSTLGLQPGDIILAVGDREVKDADHVRRILRSYGPDEDITFRIMRQKKEMSVRGSLGR